MSNQLVKKNPTEGYQNVFPKTFIDAIKDKESGVSLQEILQGFNMYFLSYNGSRALTRCKVPSILRKEGLWITYVLYDHTVVTEWYNSDQIDDNSWSMDSNWRVASNNLVGDISVSSDGYWVINGEKTEARAQGEQGVTPLLRVGANNKLQVSYNAGKAWKDISDYIVPRFKWNQGAGTTAGTIQISMDLGKTWTNLSNEITNNLRISRYIGTNESLPTSGVAEGTIYMKGPYYDEGDTSNTNPIYRMWVYAWKGNTLAWQDNGEFTVISARVVQERGNSTTEVMSQDAITRELTKLEDEASQLGQKVNEFFSRSISQAENPGTASSFWINNNGVIGMQESGMGLHRADYIEVSPEEDVYISTTLGGASALIFLFCDNSGNVIDTAIQYAGEGDPAPRFVTVPSGATRLYINYLSTYSVVIVGHIETLENTINNLCQPFVASRGIEAATGIMKLYGGDDYFLTAFIDVTNIPYISYDLLFGSTEYNLISAFDKGKNYIPENSVQPDKGWAEKSGIWTKGNNTKYIIIGFRGNEHRFAFNANPLPTPGAVTMEMMNSAISEGISEYQEQYGARKPDSNTSPMSLSESKFELGNLQGGTGAEILVGNVIRSTIYYPVVPEDKLACATANSYRVSIFEYKKDLSYVSNGGWITGNGDYQLKDNTEFIRICLASPSGVSTRPVWNDAGLTIIPGMKYVPARAEAIDETDKAMYELPIIAPCPQIPADGSNEEDFNAETLTPSILYSAFDSLLATLQKPGGNMMNYPKFGTKYSKVGRDATNAYDINAYVFGKRNRYGWKAADALFAWKNGQNVLYTDSISPRVGDVLYSDANRTNSGKTTAIFSASDMSITSSDSTTYARQKSEDIAAVVVYSTLAQKVSSPYINIEVYDKTGSLLGTATAVDASTISYNSKNYTRCEDYDFHNKQKGSIILWGNEHGPQSDPAECAITLYRMAKDLCDGCRNNPFLSWLKENFMFILVPCVNPYGLVNHTRENGNRVNINRNYSTPGWSVVVDADKGTYAGDQSETQFVMNLCATMNPAIAIDIHCLGYVTATNEGKVHYEGQILAKQQLTRAIDTLGGFSFALSSYGEADPNTKSHGADWLTYQGIVGGLIEMNAGPYSTQPNGEQHSSHIMATDYTLLLNMIRVWLQEWNNKLDLSYLFIR